MTQTNAA